MPNKEELKRLYEQGCKDRYQWIKLAESAISKGDSKLADQCLAAINQSFLDRDAIFAEADKLDAFGYVIGWDEEGKGEYENVL
ncbi:hypothetical protein [Holdemania massiliensis]|uniref:hypothetical protein n=1 Tax=Holdemania massiliensis TaxID=1468449 RepID=UPI001F051D91|nr:hypothetical protein [Holdemania massiliensis]MCH1942447.1 hypothetical protein [Holdemania massiliensis]